MEFFFFDLVGYLRRIRLSALGEGANSYRKAELACSQGILI